MSHYDIEEMGHYDLDGKVSVSGKVVGFWSKRSDYGIQQGFTVQLDDGSVYKGTLPIKLASAVEGDRVKFTANFICGKADFKRPSKASIN